VVAICGTTRKKEKESLNYPLLPTNQKERERERRRRGGPTSCASMTTQGRKRGREERLSK